MSKDLVEKIEEEKRERRRQRLMRLGNTDALKLSKGEYILVSRVDGDYISGKKVKRVPVNRVSIDSILKRKELYVSRWVRI